MPDLQEQVDAQLKAVFKLLKDARERAFNGKKMAEALVYLLPEYMEHKIERTRYSGYDNHLTRLHYLRAAALWLADDKDQARGVFLNTRTYSCDELEFCEALLR